MTEADRIRNAAQAMLAGDRHACRPILELGYDAMARGTQRAYAKHAPDKAHEADEALTGFLEAKLEDQRFLGHLANAEKPLGLLYKAALNYAIERLRRPAAPPPELPTEEELEPERDLDDADAVLASLPIAHRALLHVFFVERAGANDSVVEWIAQQRQVAPSVVRKELAARARAIEEQRTLAQDEVESRYAELLRLQSRHNLVFRVIQELDGQPAAPADLESRRASELRTDHQLRLASPGERSALLVKLEERMRTQRRLQGEAASKATDPLAGRPDYAEVAFILGMCGPHSTDAERSTATNTATVTIRRLRRRVAAQRRAHA